MMLGDKIKKVLETNSNNLSRLNGYIDLTEEEQLVNSALEELQELLEIKHRYDSCNK